MNPLLGIAFTGIQHKPFTIKIKKFIIDIIILFPFLSIIVKFPIRSLRPLTLTFISLKIRILPSFSTQPIKIEDIIFMNMIAIQNNPISKNTKKFLKNIGITDISAVDTISFSSLEQNLLPYDLEKIVYELMPLGCLRHPDGEIFIFDIPMTKRLLHILANYDVYYLSRLAKYSLREIMQFRNLGANTFHELEKVCKEYETPLPD